MLARNLHYGMTKVCSKAKQMLRRKVKRPARFAVDDILAF
jgi:hypothetical protein